MFRFLSEVISRIDESRYQSRNDRKMFIRISLIE